MPKGMEFQKPIGGIKKVKTAKAASAEAKKLLHTSKISISDHP